MTSFKLWLSITPALGCASRPSISRRFITSTVLIVLEQAGVPPSVEIAPHRRHRRKAFGQHPPRTAARRNIQQRVYNLAHVRRPTPTSRLRRRNEWCRPPPFALRHIAWISQTFPAMFAPGNTSPSHGFLHLFAKTAESQDTGIAQLLSDQALRV